MPFSHVFLCLSVQLLPKGTSKGNHLHSENCLGQEGETIQGC